MDIKKIKAIVDLVKESGISELEISEGEDSLRVSYLSSALHTHAPMQVTTNAPQYIAQQSHQVQVPQVSSSPAPAPVVEVPKVSAITIKSPMVGTFYKSSSPTSEAFVKVGDVVKKGQVLCIIEAMKLMNQIESDKDGEIVDILVNNGSAVEYDQDLFIIR